MEQWIIFYIATVGFINAILRIIYALFRKQIDTVLNYLSNPCEERKTMMQK